ncbi:Acetyl-coenzyme A carboxyl transferase alpha chain [hydrothermal vent metagenome]|uniref:acetyl-CoA carboxytransferase n=1 Tax=hydrothermal vent metagenome TaxID=652676 RepID=A0A3B0SDR1_9ZZZZ
MNLGQVLFRMTNFLEFESQIADIRGKVAELKALAKEDEAMSIDDEVEKLEARADKHLLELYTQLDPWQKTQVARHPDRPHCKDYVAALISEFTPIAGDRKFSEDQAIISGLGRFQGEPVMVLGQEKGHDTDSRLKRNFGMARPEGYRKAVRLMELAERFDLPVISFVDTSGAYPGIGAEERGQAEAIARSTDCCLGLGVPIISTIIGEGGSGGAIAIATANTVLMLEHAIYSVISPEGAASILWKDSAKAQDAAKSMKITATDLKGFSIIDEIIAEPVGGAHRDRKQTMSDVGEAIARALLALKHLSPDELRKQRREKFLAIGRNL